MFSQINRHLKRLDARLRRPLAGDLSDPAMRRQANWQFQLMDHAFLRLWWSNFARVSDGVFRANQPSPARLARWHKSGIRTVLNLRGDSRQSFHLLEREACDRLGIQLFNISLSARALPAPEKLIELEALFHSLPKPFVMHCKSGADRAGLASALYLMLIEGRPVAEATQQLHWRFLHLKSSKTGILDQFLHSYTLAYAQSGVTLMDWIRTGYDPQKITATFQGRKA
ncbi:MAG: tyrosine-protein phosphatase [Pseudorhodobacter sp.]|nr:tyrosine-protein phosphatase [Pseudorhodobacter sp.]